MATEASSRSGPPGAADAAAEACAEQAGAAGTGPPADVGDGDTDVVEDRAERQFLLVPFALTVAAEVETKRSEASSREPVSKAAEEAAFFAGDAAAMDQYDDVIRWAFRMDEGGAR